MRNYWWDGSFDSEIIKAVAGPSYLKGKAFENRASDVLSSLGYKVWRQVSVPDRGDGRRGFVDLVAVKGPVKAAIELDRVNPRCKSIFKVQQIKDATFRLVFCRQHFKQKP